MDIMDIIAQAQQGQGLEALGRKFNLNPGQARAALDELAPAVMAGIRRESDTPDALSGLLSALGNGNHGRYLQGNDPGIVDDGNAILGHIFGSKDVSRGVAAKAAETTGLDAGVLKQMLPQIAAMVMGALGSNLGGSTGQRSNVASQEQGLGGLLGQILGGATGGPQSGQSSGDGGLGGLGGMLGGVLGGQSSAPASGSGGLGDLLGSLLGTGAQPEVRDQAVKKLSGVVGSALGAGTAKAKAADQLLDSVGYQPKAKRAAAPARNEGPRGPRRGG
jgi:hypothetical protein